ncbi:hypothetical protein F2P79_021107 [Pimephales promelas]|nr:hypothetical protein F2P79_021107 [Pimephales promelas]
MQGARGDQQTKPRILEPCCVSVVGLILRDSDSNFPDDSFRLVQHFLWCADRLKPLEKQRQIDRPVRELDSGRIIAATNHPVGFTGPEIDVLSFQNNGEPYERPDDVITPVVDRVTYKALEIPRSRSPGENHNDEALVTTNTAENTSKPPDTCVTDGPSLPVRDEKGEDLTHTQNTLPEHPSHSRSLRCQVYGYVKIALKHAVRITSSFFHKLQTGSGAFQAEGDVLLSGNVNARTGSECDSAGTLTQNRFSGLSRRSKVIQDCSDPKEDLLSCRATQTHKSICFLLVHLHRDTTTAVGLYSSECIDRISS